MRLSLKKLILVTLITVDMSSVPGWQLAVPATFCSRLPTLPVLFLPALLWGQPRFCLQKVELLLRMQELALHLHWKFPAWGQTSTGPKQLQLITVAPVVAGLA